MDTTTGRTALDLGRERFRLGLGSIVEATQTEVAVTRAESSLVVARFEAQIFKAALDYATGRTNERFGTIESLG